MSISTPDPDSETAGFPGLTLRLFGRFELALDGVPLSPLRPRSAQWILALLALRSRPMERAVLAATLWPESPEETALANLRRYLVQIRRVLGNEAHRLRSPEPRSLEFDLAGAWCDALEFDGFVRSGSAKALGLYRGPLLEGCQAEWVLPAREARAQAYLQLLERLAAEAEAGGDFPTAIRYLREAITRDPLAETSHRSLIRALGATGNYAGATQVYRDLRILLHRELNAAPDPSTAAVYEQVRASAAEGPRKPAPAAGSRSHLPHALSSFVGRQSECGEVLKRLRAARLVTLTGPGGVGKTRLALRCAEALSPELPEGAWFVDFSQVADPALVWSATATALETRETQGSPLRESVAARIGDRPMLVILDNCEHVLTAATEVAASLLGHCPHLRILATSRQALGITGEVVFRVPSLSLPISPQGNSPAKDDVPGLMESDAFRLFIDRASGASSRFTLTPRTAEAVEAICRRVDGIPLAIELAAARARAMDVTRIRERLEQDHALLVGGGGAPERQRTLGGLIDWSYRLLSKPEQALFQRLSVFTGGWSLEAAEAVTAPDSGTRNAVLDLLAALVEKSLVDYEPSDGEDRYRMLQTLQSFAHERLSEAGELDEARRRYVEFYVAYAEGVAEVGDQREKLRRFDREWDNLAAAAAVSEEAVWGAELGLRLVAALRGYWLPKGLPQLGLSFTRRALERAAPQAPSKTGAEALLAAGTLSLRTGDYVAAETLLTRALEEGRGLALPNVAAGAMTMLGHTARLRGDDSSARDLFENAIATARACGAVGPESGALNGLAEMRRAAGDLEEAAVLYEAALERVRDSGEAHASAIVMNNLAMTRILLGELDAGRALLVESVEIARALESPQPAAFTLMVACGLAVAREQWRLGARTLGGVETLRRRMGLRQEPADALFEAVGTRRAREALGEEAFAAEHVQGEGQPYPLLLDEIGEWLAGLTIQGSATADG